eukprot:5972238-Pyramimonas_sp.AAC.1
MGAPSLPPPLPPPCIPFWGLMCGPKRGCLRGGLRVFEIAMWKQAGERRLNCEMSAKHAAA